MTKAEKKSYDAARYQRNKLARQEQQEAWFRRYPGGKAAYMKLYWKRRKARENHPD